MPTNLIGDKAQDSDQFDEALRAQGTEMISPHRSTRKRKTQDARRLRRYERRWIVERFFAWLQSTGPLSVDVVSPPVDQRTIQVWRSMYLEGPRLIAIREPFYKILVEVKKQSDFIGIASCSIA